MGERREDRGQGRGRRVARLLADLHGPGAAGGRDRGARDAGVVVGLREDVGLVASERLGRVHRGVGVADERVHAQLGAGPAGDADRDRDRDLRAAVDREALALHGRAQLLGQRGAFLDAGLGQDEHELLAAVAADEVGCAQAGRDRLGDAAQDDVADGVAVRVVDGLEVVDVDERDRQRALVARRALDLAYSAPMSDCRLATPVSRSTVARSWVSVRAAAMSLTRPTESTLEGAAAR